LAIAFAGGSKLAGHSCTCITAARNSADNWAIRNPCSQRRAVHFLKPVTSEPGPGPEPGHALAFGTTPRADVAEELAATGIVKELVVGLLLRGMRS